MDQDNLAQTILDKFEIAKFLFNFRARESGRLPEYKGGLLRGGFGYTFRNIACIYKNGDCPECKDKDRCPYHYIFDTTPTQQDGKFSIYSDVPRPFIVEPDNDRKRSYAQGDPLQFGLILVGKAIEYFPYFVFCFEELGRRGMGSGKTRFMLESVSGFDFTHGQLLSVYEPESRILTDKIPTIHAKEIWPESHTDVIRLEFLTPTRIKYRDKYISYLEFHVMIRNLLRRISMLQLFHSHNSAINDPEVQPYINNLINEAKIVEIKIWDLEWHDWERYSTRKERDIKMGGFMGNIEYMGKLDKFMPFVALGEYIHIGKGTTFGLGKYCIDSGKNI